MKSCFDGAPDERGRCPAAEPVALMRSLVVVVAHELSERPLQRRAPGEVSASEGDAPVLWRDRARQALDEAVGPGMARLRAGVAQAELPTGLIEGSVELGAPVGQDAPQGPPRPSKERPEDVAQKRRGIGRRVGRQQRRHAVGAGGVARRDLPHLADPLEVADVEGVQTDQLPRLGGLDVARPPVARAPQPLARDRKSTRLNSSHGYISYAVFCLTTNT